MLPKAYWSDFESKGLMWKAIVYWKEIFDRKLTSFFRLQWEHRFGFPFAHLKFDFITLGLIYGLYLLSYSKYFHIATFKLPCNHLFQQLVCLYLSMKTHHHCPQEVELIFCRISNVYHTFKQNWKNWIGKIALIHENFSITIFWIFEKLTMPHYLYKYM